MKAAFHIPSISCSNCARKIQEEVRSMKGVHNVSVDLKTQMLNIEYDPDDLQSADVRKNIGSMGYEVV